MDLKRSPDGYSTHGTQSQQMLVYAIFIVMAISLGVMFAISV